MATVVVTFLLTIRIHVPKMDAEYEEAESGPSTRREKRWSMNSQRLESIVAELMKPIGDLRHSFDTDLSSLLEEYLTEAGLRALEDDLSDTDEMVAPNFAELALLLQQSANIYGRKVDCLYQHVLSVSDSLQNSTLEASALELEAATPSGRRKRKPSSGAAGSFELVPLEACPSARREPGPARPPPTLPRGYIELEPRQVADTDAQLLDYEGEPIGLLSDFHVTWRLQDGLLVDELEDYTSKGASLRPIPLVELQAAIEAAAPYESSLVQHSCEQSPVREPSHERSPSPSWLRSSTPMPERVQQAVEIMMQETEKKKKDVRKRKSDVKLEEVTEGIVKKSITKGVVRKLRRLSEYSLPMSWVAREVRRRADAISATRDLLAQDQHDTDFRGYDLSPLDAGGFRGWSNSEAEIASGVALRLRSLSSTLRESEKDSGEGERESDDDGFFEQSSLGDSDADQLPLNSTQKPEWGGPSASGGGEGGWQARVLSQCASAAARGPPDVRVLGGRVVRALGAADGCELQADRLLAEATHPADVSALFLATLFLANAHNVELVQGAPLSLNSFSARLLSADQRRLDALAERDHDPLLR